MKNEEHAKRMKALYARLFYQEQILQEDLSEGPKCLDGDCENGTGTIQYSDGSKYSGEFQNAKKHGTGTLTYPDGQIKTGTWKDDLFVGLLD